MSEEKHNTKEQVGAKLLLPLFRTMCPTEHDLTDSVCPLNGGVVGALTFPHHSARSGS